MNNLQITFSKLNFLTASVIIAILGIVVFSVSLSNPFIGDDQGQIVDNQFVHSVSHITTLFQSSTFYDAVDHPELTGHYYRPLMMVIYSALYTLFGPNPAAFHLLQLILHIANAILLFLVFRYFFRPALALGLAVIFLIHPINSQAVFAIATLQEPLYFFFGILAFWSLLRFQFRSSKFLILTTICLLLSLLSKESGVLFVAISALYLFFFDKKRLYPFIGLMGLFMAAYIALKIHAVGFATNPHNAQIDELNIWGRLATVPAIITFYVIAFVFPIHLAHAYFWVYPHISFLHFYLPMTAITLILCGLVYLAIILRRKGFVRQYALFSFFGAWLVTGLLIHLQLIPLDFTASETWFYFPIVGALGMIGALADAFPVTLPRSWVISCSVLVFSLLIARTMTRAPNWSSNADLAYHDITVSKEDYSSEFIIASDLFARRQFNGAKAHAIRSIELYPNALSYNILGQVSASRGNFAQAKQAFLDGLKYQDRYGFYANLAALTVYYGNPNDGRAFIKSAIKKFPQKGKLWLCLALLEYKNHNTSDAKSAIQQAYNYDPGNKYYFDIITNDQPLDLSAQPNL